MYIKCHQQRAQDRYLESDNNKRPKSSHSIEMIQLSIRADDSLTRSTTMQCKIIMFLTLNCSFGCDNFVLCGKQNFKSTVHDNEHLSFIVCSVDFTYSVVQPI